MKFKINNKGKYKNLSCRKCKSNNIIKRGFRLTENRGKIQRFSCKDCGIRFIIDDGFFRMRNNEKRITLCLDLFFRGVSTRKVQEHLQAFYPKNASWVSVYSWIVKYSNMISNFTDKLNINSGNEIQIDEMEFKTKGKPSWFVDVIDTKTRFMVPSSYVRSREKQQIKEMLFSIKNRTNGNVKKITTDGFNLYRKVVKKSFGYNKKLGKYNVEHNIVNSSQGEGFNIMIERLHNNVRQRTKTFRGFHGSIESANAIMKGYEIFYNFITKHQAINKCPYELAIPELILTSENRWLELIKLSKEKDI